MTLTLLAIGTVCLLLAMHPFVTYPLSLMLLRKKALHEPTNVSAPKPMTFAICMCAYNEEKVIERKIQNLLRLRERRPGLQILIYVDASSDRTAEILRPYAPAIDLHISPARHGKTHGMNLLAARAQADILVFTDANVMLDLDCVDDLQRHFADPVVGCVGGHLSYTNGDASVTAASGSLYWRFEEAVKRMESQSGSMMGADGSLFAIRRSLHRSPPDHIIDDMYVSLMALVQGYRVIQAQDVRAFEESVTSGSEEFARKVRIGCQAFNVHRLLWPQLRRLDGLTLYKYVSHKLIRWLSIYFLGAAALAYLGALVLGGHTTAAVALTAAALTALFVGWRWSVKPFAQIVDLFVALSGAGLGVWQSLRGERFQTWQPANSIRRA